MKITKLLFGDDITKERIKVKAHAFTFTAVIWFFFSLVAVMFWRDGFLTNNYSECFFAVGVWLAHIALIIIAIALWVYERKTEVTIIKTSIDIGIGPID